MMTRAVVGIQNALNPTDSYSGYCLKQYEAYSSRDAEFCIVVHLEAVEVM